MANEDESENKSKRLIEIDFIKMLSAFLVICHHFGTETMFFKKSLVAVPIFMILSFYFLFKKLDEDFNIYNRIKRLFIPLLGSSVIYYLVYKFILDRQVSISDFFWQITFGHSPRLNQTMWFSNNLIILTILVYLFRKCFIKYPLISSVIVFLISYFLQYFGYNVLIFSNLREELSAPLGRLVEMLPFISVGCLFAHYHLFSYFKDKKIILLSIGIYILFKLIKIPRIDGFSYPGIKLMMKSVLWIICVYAIPFQKISEKIKIILSVMCKYTLGIYCFHRLVEACIHDMLVYFNIDEKMLSCVIIYILSYFCCFLIAKIPLKPLKMMVE